MFRQENRNELRRLADKSYRLGLSYFDKNEWNRCCTFLKEAADYLLGIWQKTTNDHKRLIRIYYQIGNSYFNSNQYNHALFAYQSAIDYYGSILPILDDEDYRQQIKLFINICDSHLALNKIEMANASLLKAIEVFEKIANKNPDELALKRIDHNPTLFYEYYEKRTSSYYFVNSIPHLKQAEKLENYYHQNRLDNILDNIANIDIKTPITVKIKTDPMNEITTQLSQLSFLSNNNNNNDDDIEMNEISAPFISNSK